MKALATVTLLGVALAGFTAQAQPNFQLLDKIAAAQPHVADVSKAVADELDAYPTHSLEILKAALNKVTPEWSADEVTSMIRTAFATMPVQQIHQLIPEVKTLVASYQDQFGDNVAKAVLDNLDQLALPVANAVLQQRAATNSQARQQVPVAPKTPVVVPSTPDDVSTN